MSVRGFAAKNFIWQGCVKVFSKHNLDGDIFLISLCEIKKMSPSKEYFAAEGGKRPFNNPVCTHSA